MTGALDAVQRLARFIDGRRLVPALHRGAVSNAHTAMDDLHRAVTERQLLQQPGERHVVRMSAKDTMELLERGSLGRLAYVARKGIPDIVPVNYAWADGTVLIRTGPGPKLQAAQRGEVVAFEVDEIDVERRAAQSAVVVGRAAVVGPLTAVPPVDVWADGRRSYCIRIVPTRVEGRRLA